MGKKSEYFTKASYGDNEFLDIRYDHSAYDDDDGFDGYEVSAAAIDPHYELLLAVALYCCLVSLVVFFLMKIGKPKRFSRLVQNIDKVAVRMLGKVRSASTHVYGKARYGDNNTDGGDGGDDTYVEMGEKKSKEESPSTTTEVTQTDTCKAGGGSVTPYQPLEEDSQQQSTPSDKQMKHDPLLCVGDPASASKYQWPRSELISIHKLAAPWLFSSLVSHVYSIAVVYLISHYIGEDDSVAYITVEFYLYMFHLFSYGIYDAFYRNATVAIGTGDHELVGQQTHISMLLAGVASVPAILFSLFWMEDFLLWLGFADYIAAKGHDYAILASCLALFDNMNSIWWALLDLTGHEFFSAGFDFIESVTGLTLTAIAIVRYDFNGNARWRSSAAPR